VAGGPHSQQQQLLTVGDDNALYAWVVAAEPTKASRLAQQRGEGAAVRHSTAASLCQAPKSAATQPHGQFQQSQGHTITAATDATSLVLGLGTDSNATVPASMVTHQPLPADRTHCTAALLSGFTPSGEAQNVIWHPSTGLFAYAGEVRSESEQLPLLLNMFSDAEQLEPWLHAHLARCS
jgi:hypothetical protein